MAASDPIGIRHSKYPNPHAPRMVLCECAVLWTFYEYRAQWPNRLGTDSVSSLLVRSMNQSSMDS